MTAPNRQDVDAMANILRALNGDTSGIKSQPTPSTPSGSPIDLTPGVSSDDVKAMENILKNFYGASKNVAKKVVSTINESTKIENGVAVGVFSIEKNSKELYDIRDVRSQDTLFEGLRLYETAYLLAKYLNEGKKINSAEITKIISSNAVFETYYYDAISHKRSYNTAKKRGDATKMDIAEARFDRAKSEAQAAHMQIKALYENKR
jgi:hypothetical protein